MRRNDTASGGCRGLHKVHTIQDERRDVITKCLAALYDIRCYRYEYYCNYYVQYDPPAPGTGRVRGRIVNRCVRPRR